MARFIARFHDGGHEVVDTSTGEVVGRYQAGYAAHRGAARRYARRLNEEVSRDGSG